VERGERGDRRTGKNYQKRAFIKMTTELTTELKERFAKARRNVAERKEAEKVKQPSLGMCLPGGLLAAAKARVNSPDFKQPENEFWTDGNAGVIFYRLTEHEIRDKNALDFHGNDPNIRFDDCGFPKNRDDRKFSLSHNFGRILPEALKSLNKGKWIMLSGNMGTGKTALAIRMAWEKMKRQPTLRPSYLCMNSWMRSNMPDEERQSLENIRRFVVFDDFDKFNLTTEFQAQCCLRLIQKLIDDDHRVILTSNFSIDLLSKKDRHFNFDLCLDRLRGRCV